jgi:hypothetical protein
MNRFQRFDYCLVRIIMWATHFDSVRFLARAVGERPRGANRRRLAASNWDSRWPILSLDSFLSRELWHVRCAAREKVINLNRKGQTKLPTKEDITRKRMTRTVRFFSRCKFCGFETVMSIVPNMYYRTIICGTIMYFEYLQVKSESWDRANRTTNFLMYGPCNSTLMGSGTSPDTDKAKTSQHQHICSRLPNNIASAPGMHPMVPSLRLPAPDYRLQVAETLPGRKTVPAVQS